MGRADQPGQGTGAVFLSSLKGAKVWHSVGCSVECQTRALSRDAESHETADYSLPFDSYEEAIAWLAENVYDWKRP